MSPRPSLLQRLAVFIPVVLLWSSSFRAQAQAIAKCWVFSPVVDEATIRANVSTLSSMEPGSGRQLWSVSSRVTWARPTSLDSHGGYAVSVLRMPSFKTPRFCQMEQHEILVSTEEHVFTDLDFGFLYEFTVFVVNGTGRSKSLVGVTKGFGTPESDEAEYRDSPGASISLLNKNEVLWKSCIFDCGSYDCFQATGDREFCTTAVVQYAGAPIEPRLESQCLQANSLLAAHLSWDPPIQVNGEITAYKVQYARPDAPPGTLPNVVTAMPDPASAEGRVNGELLDMTADVSYSVLVSAFVISLEDGSFNEGLQVELKFRTADTQAHIPICPSPAPTTPSSPTIPPIIPNQPPKQPGVSVNRLQTTQSNEPAITATPPIDPNQPPKQPPDVDVNYQQTTPANSPATTTPPGKPTSPPSGGVNHPGPPTHPSHPRTTTVSTTTTADVEEKPVAPSKRAGIAIAACLVSLGVVCAVAMLILHVVRKRMATKSAARPDTKGAQKGKKAVTSPA